MGWRGWMSDVTTALAGLALAFVTLYILGALTAGVQTVTCADQCQADRLAAVGQKL